MTKELICGSRVRWCLVPGQPFILRAFYVRFTERGEERPWTHMAVIAEDKPYGLSRPVPTSELEMVS